MNMVFSGALWALVTFYGPMQIDGSLYLHRAACERAMQHAIRGYGCTPAPGESACSTGPIPQMQCLQMKVAPNQVIQRFAKPGTAPRVCVKALQFKDGLVGIDGSRARPGEVLRVDPHCKSGYGWGLPTL